jgi:hypothetical protein
LQPSAEYQTSESALEYQVPMPKLNSQKDKNIEMRRRVTQITGRFYLKILKTIFFQSLKGKRNEHYRHDNLRIDPPIITTTAATPEDSPNTSLETGVSFKSWEHLDIESIDKSVIVFFRQQVFFSHLKIIPLFHRPITSNPS